MAPLFRDPMFDGLISSLGLDSDRLRSLDLRLRATLDAPVRIEIRAEVLAESGQVSQLAAIVGGLGPIEWETDAVQHMTKQDGADDGPALNAGDRVRYIPGPRKYNQDVDIPAGAIGVVTEVPEGCDDAVQVRIAGGHGAVDVARLEKL